MHQSSGKYSETLKTIKTHIQCCGRRVDGEKWSNSYINCGRVPPTDSLLRHYDYDIIMPL